MSVESTILPASHTFGQQESRQASKFILRSALQKANTAVRCDSTNDVLGALHAYKEAVELLNRVLNLIDKESDKRRLQEIHDSYSERIRLLTAIANEEVKEEEEEEEWLIKSRLQKATIRKITSIEFKSNETSLIIQASKSTPSTAQKQQEQQQEEICFEQKEECRLDQKIEKKKVPSLTLPSLKKKEEDEQPSKRSTRTRTSSLPKVPRSSSMSTVETLVEDQPKYPTKLLASSIGSIRKKAVNRLSMEGIVGHQTKDTDDLKEHQHLELILALQKSMQQGAYITKKLYIPKSLWQQSNVKLSYIDIKISACTTIINDISRLESWTYLNDLTSSLRLLDHVELSVEGLKSNLSKKLKSERSKKKDAGNSNQTTNSIQTIHHSAKTERKASQSFISWGTKLSKSVERMNAFSLSKGDYNYKQYIEVLESLFNQVHVLENWLNYYYEEKKRSDSPQYDMIIVKTIKVCDAINTVVGGFIIRDITVLLAQWLKRGSSWVNE
ncbi:hypothetical protein G6F57_003873 [Rhizopus arrhizus]|uniref:MIT domain-containing protein n=1 Tax=Rhizopus oryzae TaxID=64495 RepID=A0A9P6XGA0_RHIOR|nr:hypothetical protein G6F23_000405 [Rhizopus arrhizus]KAG1428497.1 hypothetical protein G6F58_000528 [Rhizopus delemar]KAG0766288.1 hypothetical protein G6F24_003719 [Rhizopus arrhizus]KAG0794858.1 hypothetical protein G6F21_002544 [Rhizopus arrhizus]KAG0795488.1 hypothetical protein G6F22_005109 [Rhizopus arrhizus]